MDEVWVPTEWHKRVFVDTMRSMGIPSTGNVVVIPEAVDTAIFSPALVRTHAEGNQFSVRSRNPQHGCHLQATADSEAVVCPHFGAGEENRNRFHFLSVFKWERRKGWDVLLAAYWAAFKKTDDVVLVLRTYVPAFTAHIDPNITQHIEDFAQTHFQVSHTELASVVWSSDVITRADVRDLLASVDAFVLPTRGEGWGLPVAEAMAMQLPTVVTNCSGPAAYATNDNAYLIPVLPELDDAAFVQPNATALAQLLRLVVHDSGPHGGGRAQWKGARARKAMQEISPDYVASLMAERLRMEAERRGWQF
jgi:glycosyltransferase involved in cell wall biosynthesis